MTITHTQNRPYDFSKRFMVRATFNVPPSIVPEVLIFDWNDREQVRNFAAQSDRIIRNGGTTTLGPVT
jgi:hypothetical protein